MKLDPNLLIALCSVIIAFVALVVTVTRNNHTDVQKELAEAKESAKRDAKIEASLDSIQSDTREIKEDIGSLKKEVADHGQRLAVIEDSTKKDHHRIEMLENMKERDN